MDAPRRPTRRKEFEEELRRFKTIIEDEEKRRVLLNTAGNDAQEWLDVLQLLAEYPDVETTLRSMIFKVMIRISRNTGLCPACLTVKNVERLGEHPVGGGAFGDVWKGKIGGEVVCMKVLRVFSTSEVKHLLKDYMQEAIVWRQLNHSNLLPFMGIYYLDSNLNRLCLISPWMERGNLLQFMKDSPELVQPDKLAHDVACGLTHLHGIKIVHGDLKGVNVLITPDLRACITDFGLSRISDTQRLISSSTNHSQGTTRWLSPELLRPGPNCVISKASDVYAFGCVCYEIYTRRIPFHELMDAAVIFAVVIDKQLPTRPSDLPVLADAVWDTMVTCWRAEPSSRPAMVDVVERIQEILPNHSFEPAPGWDNTQIWNNLKSSAPISMTSHQNTGSGGPMPPPILDTELSATSDVSMDIDPELPADPLPGGISRPDDRDLQSTGGQTGLERNGGVQASQSEGHSRGVKRKYTPQVDPSAAQAQPPLQQQSNGKDMMPMVGVLSAVSAAPPIAISTTTGTGSHSTSAQQQRQPCLGCGATSSPAWRKGPMGPRTLCNACGLQYSKLNKKRPPPGQTQPQHGPSGISGALVPDDTTPTASAINIPAGNFPEDVDVATYPPALKKEGSDWYAIFNPKVEKGFDVSLVHTLMHESVVCCVRFSPDGKYLATGCNRTVQIYDTKTGVRICVLVDQDAWKGDLYIRTVCFSPDGKLLATGAEDKRLRIWDIAKRRIRNIFDGHQQEIYSLDFSSDGRLLVSGSGDKTARIWDMMDGTSKVLTIGHPDSVNIDGGITSTAISPNGQYVAAGSLDPVVRIWDAATGQLVERLRGHRDSVYSVAFTPDGKGLVSGSLDNTTKYWDVSALMASRLAKDREEGQNGSASAPGALNSDGDNQSRYTMDLTKHKDYVLSVAVSRDNQWVVSGSKDCGVQFWDSRNATVQCMLQGHKNSVISVDLSPSGNVLASGSGDWQARIWSYTTK